jgi:hypothetical protein
MASLSSTGQHISQDNKLVRHSGHNIEVSDCILDDVIEEIALQE